MVRPGLPADVHPDAHQLWQLSGRIDCRVGVSSTETVRGQRAAAEGEVEFGASLKESSVLWLFVFFSRLQLFQLAWYSALPLAIGLLLSAYVFYAYDFEKPAVWIALYAAFSKNLWGVIFGVLFVGLALGVGGND